MTKQKDTWRRCFKSKMKEQKEFWGVFKPETVVENFHWEKKCIDSLFKKAARKTSLRALCAVKTDGKW